MQAFGFTINLLTLLPSCSRSPGGGRRDRHRRKRRAPSGEGRTPLDAALVGARELVGPIIAMTITLAASTPPSASRRGDRFALPRIRLHPGGHGRDFRPGRPDLVAHDVCDPARPGDDHKGFAGVVGRLFERLRESYGRVWPRPAESRLDLRPLDRGRIGRPPDDHAVAGRTRPGRGPRRRFWHHDGGGQRHARSDEPIRGAAGRAFRTIPRPTSPSSSPSEQRLRRLGGQALSQRKRSIYQILPEVQGKLMAIPGIQMFAALPPALPGGIIFRWSSSFRPRRTSTRSSPRAKIADDAAKSGMFAFPPILDVKVDQPQAEVVIDRNKVRPSVSTCSRSAPTWLRPSAQLRQLLRHLRRSYKVIPRSSARTGSTPASCGTSMCPGRAES